MSTKHPPRTPHHELMFLLTETARHVRTHVDHVARDHGTTRAQWGLLARLRRMEGASQIDLADDMELTPIALARLADRLAEQGLIERRPDAHDRRINRLHLTREGRQTVDGLDGLRRSIAHDVLAGVSEADIATAIAVLQRITHNVRNPSQSPARTRQAAGEPALPLQI